MKVLVTGGTGFVGSALVTELKLRGHEVALLSRSAKGGNARAWDPERGRLEPDVVAGFDAVVHLAGETILGLWTESKRRRIRESRVHGTSLLTRTLLALPASDRPKHFISASAVGYYGDRGDEVLTDDAPPGNGWLAETAVEWESASAPLADADVRVVWMRIGIVLDPAGGALKYMLPAFKLGAGGKLGSGVQWFSWISRRDLVTTLVFLLEHQEMRGALNVVAPGAVTNAEFTRELATHLHRPAMLPVPAPILSMLPGKMAEQTLLASTRVKPQKLQAAGFRWHDGTLKEFFNGLQG